MKNTQPKAKPFLKWAGGKTQLLAQMKTHFPQQLQNEKITRYVEPLVGSGAVFFHVAHSYHIPGYFISDRNQELILAYKSVQGCVDQVIARLFQIQQAYYQLDAEEQERYYYQVRATFNANLPQIDFSQTSPMSIERTVQLIFLNRTCYNGLFRVNAKGEFNVPFGRYKNPQIWDAENLKSVSEILKPTQIWHGDFTSCLEFVNAKTFVYFDPPYRPISKTASFKSYSKHKFDDSEQARLAQFYRELHQIGAKLMLSNSDPHNENPEDDFFDKLYRSANFKIHRLKANRMINSDTTKRGPITELLITNY